MMRSNTFAFVSTLTLLLIAAGCGAKTTSTLDDRLEPGGEAIVYCKPGDRAMVSGLPGGLGIPAMEGQDFIDSGTRIRIIRDDELGDDASRSATISILEGKYAGVEARLNRDRVRPLPLPLR